MMRTQIDPVLPTHQDALCAGEVRHALERLDASHKPLRVHVDAAAFDLPPIVTRLLLNILEETAAGHAVTLVPVDSEITTQQAAEILNVSRPFLVGMIEKGILPARRVGKHRRLPLRDVLAYKADNFAKRKKTLEDLVAYDQELGLA